MLVTKWPSLGIIGNIDAAGRCWWQFWDCRRPKVTNVTVASITFAKKCHQNYLPSTSVGNIEFSFIRKLFENCPWQKQLERELIRKVSFSNFCKKFYFRSKSFLKNLIFPSVWLHYKEEFWWITWLKYFNLLMYFFEKPNKKSKIKRILAR